MLLRGNNDENGCVAKCATGAQYNWRPTMLIIPGILSLDYIFQRRYFFFFVDVIIAELCAKTRVFKISQKVKMLSILFSKLFQYSSRAPRYAVRYFKTFAHLLAYLPSSIVQRFVHFAHYRSPPSRCTTARPSTAFRARYQIVLRAPSQTNARDERYRAYRWDTRTHVLQTRYARIHDAINRYSSNAVIERRRERRQAARPVRYDVSGVQFFFYSFFLHVRGVLWKARPEREKERLDKPERRDRGGRGGGGSADEGRTRGK